MLTVWSSMWSAIILCGLVCANNYAYGQKIVLDYDEEPPPAVKNEGAHTNADLQGSHLYVTFLALGATSDNFSSGVYPAAMANSIGATLLEVLETGRIHAEERRSNPALSFESVQLHTDYLETYAALQRQATLFVQYTRSGDQKTFEHLQKAREESWQKLSSLLGLSADKMRN